MCRGDDRSCPDFELHQQKLLDDLDAERRSFLKSAFLAGGGAAVVVHSVQHLLPDQPFYWRAAKGRASEPTLAACRV